LFSYVLNPLIPLFVVTTASKTGLFSAIVAAFIIESYKKLSPDSGDETVVLLRQISQQLANSTNGPNGTFPPAIGIQPSSPSTLLICVNAMWLMSLVFSISSALFATLLQQWARRYIQKPQIPRELNQRARVRSFLYDGTEKFRMRPVVEIAPTLLHVSVFLFFVGLGIFFIPINKIVGIVVSVVVGLFGLAYLTLTIFPCIKHNCPYRTPMTVFFWYSWHTLLFFAAHFLRFVAEHLHGCLVPYNPGYNPSPRQQRLTSCWEGREKAAKNHWECLKDGLEKSTIKMAEDSQGYQDGKSLAWLCHRLVALVDKNKLRRFVASIPRNKIGQLMTPPIESGKMALREPLLTIVQVCASQSAAGLDEYVSRRSLFVCLEAVRHVAEALIVSNADPQAEVLRDVRINFANISLMREVWADGDAAIRHTSRSICALLARRLIRRGQLEGPELAWLQDVIGEPSNTIFNSLGDGATLDRMNLKSFVYGVLSPDAGNLPTEHVDSFTTTLAILMDAGSQASLTSLFRTGIEDLIRRMEHDGDRGVSVANRLRHMYQLQPSTSALSLPPLQV
jgi:Family of unknown function (DUF6535)